MARTTSPVRRSRTREWLRWLVAYLGLILLVGVGTRLLLPDTALQVVMASAFVLGSAATLAFVPTPQDRDHAPRTPPRGTGS